MMLLPQLLAVKLKRVKSPYTHQAQHPGVLELDWFNFTNADSVLEFSTISASAS